MSNFIAFRDEYKAALIAPFIPGMEAHITPIQFQAITPDTFAFLFRTSGKDGTDHYFVSLEFDYAKDLASVKEIITKWCGSAVKEFLSPMGKEQPAVAELKDVQVVTAKSYYAVLSLVERPTNLGYWSENIVLKPGDNIQEKLKGYSDKHIEFVRKLIAERSENVMGLPLTNTSNYAYSVYVDGNGQLDVVFK